MVKERLTRAFGSVEGFVTDGVAEIWGHCDRSMMGSPYLIKTGSALVAGPLDARAARYRRDVVEAIVCRSGTFHMELLSADRGSVLGELNPRLIDGGTYRAVKLAGREEATAEIILRVAAWQALEVRTIGSVASKHCTVTGAGTVRVERGLAAARGGRGSRTCLLRAARRDPRPREFQRRQLRLCAGSRQRPDVGMDVGRAGVEVGQGGVGAW